MRFACRAIKDLNLGTKTISTPTPTTAKDAKPGFLPTLPSPGCKL